ncbi:hypothetical protein DFH08DRAFT_678987 [Mycena albidolilacea]|uniref:50S ribosomal protein L35 n=1 Tax=Mycena albidolilacea TaxID=1033008 RepID=A0AAD7F300_9AGAR|nr:hypothetical protein DFH08DRAFT_678987 [Mycena albidolilacea]
MFPNPFHLLSTARFCASQSLWTPRLFSTSAVVEAGYKMKSHSGAKKRWRSAPGLKSFKRGQAFRSHLNANKSPARINRLGNTAYSTPAQTHKLRKLLLPYGSG